MTNKSKRTGTEFETRTVEEFKKAGFIHAERRAQAGSLDKGDILLGPRYAVECKAQKKLELGLWLKETEQERVNAKADYGALIVKLPRRRIADCPVLIPLAQFAALLAELEGVA